MSVTCCLLSHDPECSCVVWLQRALNCTAQIHIIHMYITLEVTFSNMQMFEWIFLINPRRQIQITFPRDKYKVCALSPALGPATIKEHVHAYK